MDAEFDLDVYFTFIHAFTTYSFIVTEPANKKSQLTESWTSWIKCNKSGKLDKLVDSYKKGTLILIFESEGL